MERIFEIRERFIKCRFILLLYRFRYRIILPESVDNSSSRYECPIANSPVRASQSCISLFHARCPVTIISE